MITLRHIHLLTTATEQCHLSSRVYEALLICHSNVLTQWHIERRGIYLGLFVLCVQIVR